MRRQPEMAVVPQPAGYATWSRHAGFHVSAAPAMAHLTARERLLQRASNNPCRRAFVSRPVHWHDASAFLFAVVSMAAPRTLGGGILEQHRTDRGLCWHVTRIRSDFNISADAVLRISTAALCFCGVASIPGRTSSPVCVFCSATCAFGGAGPVPQRSSGLLVLRKGGLPSPRGVQWPRHSVR
jgi:hypothetical protein